MIKPAILYKDELEKKFAECLYTDNFFWYTGCGWCNSLPNLEPCDGDFKYVFVDSKDKIIGYLAYWIDFATDSVSRFGLFSFDRGNPLVGKDLLAKMEELVRDHRRVEWRMIGGNPVQKHYDKFCEKHGGNRVCLHQVTKDIHGRYHDEYIYEIVKE